MRTRAQYERLRQTARWCRNAAWVIAVIGFIATAIDGIVAIGEYANARATSEASAVLFPLTSLASTLLALAATIFYVALLVAISGMLDHYALTQMSAIELPP